MATLLAPFNTAMQLGTGFNSFTQQICVNGAVTSSKDGSVPDKKEPDPEKPVAQDVVYKTSIVDKVTDVTNEMNVNAAFSIKYDAFDAKGKVGFLNTSKVKEADATFMISVKVVNQVIYDHSLINFQPIEGISAENFTEVYGDCFVSGYQEGGTFTAVISVKARTEDKSREIKAKAAAKFTKTKEATEAEGEKDATNGGALAIDFRKDDMSFLDENETTISVSYTGGGQGLKEPGEDWTFETMRKAALQFPHLVAKTPMRTHAILTKYTALRSYHAHFGGLKMPAFEMAGVYSTILQEAYLDYKTIAKNLQVLAYDVSAGQSRLISAYENRKKIEEAAKPATPADANGTVVATPVSSTSNDCSDAEPTSSNDTSAQKVEEQKQQPGDRPYIWKPFNVNKDFPPTLQGLENARSMVRMILIRIVQEINILTKFPEAAMDEDRIQPHISPFLFKEFLPVGEPIKKELEDESDLDQVNRQVNMIRKAGGRM
ncbi:hypothetical protein J7337_013782 [Fusarium musae]|uniref:Uncharacterized protein n=1 Tax=Fusarium musae TaxID=1042133 RepID=A0A9P8IJT2_9HYPO|nr:hypothetical protein J7337_013782 [Fusarium musae]KAG9495533.1 hypothetical protein J7337_013782 [Fusarium musae]